MSPVYGYSKLSKGLILAIINKYQFSNIVIGINFWVGKKKKTRYATIDLTFIVTLKNLNACMLAKAMKVW